MLQELLTMISDMTAKPESPEPARARFDLIPPDAEAAIAMVLAHGTKHGDTWVDQPWSVHLNAAMGHLSRWRAGVDIDVDSGLPHIDLAATRLVLASAQYHRSRGRDDRSLLADADTGIESALGGW